MRTLILVLGLFVALPSWAEGWLCVTDQSAGFRYDLKAKKWTPTTFEKRQSYVIRRPTSKDQYVRLFGEPLSWVVQGHREREAFQSCDKEVDQVNNTLRCRGVSSTFVLNATTSRFSATDAGPYLAGDHQQLRQSLQGSVDPAFADYTVDIGRCTPM